MKENYLYLVYTLAVLLILITAGCVAPPQETSASNLSASGAQSHGSQKTTATTTTTQASYVTELNLSVYESSTPDLAGYTTYLPTTRIPEDITCRIHGINIFGYNGTAFIFNLKNPPMYINYTVVPTNITRNEVYSQKSGTYVPTTTVGEGYIPKSGKGSIKTYTYSDYSPTSWFEVTVRDNTTKEIILQDGFGENKGYSLYLTRTLKVMKSGDLLVEFRGNNLKRASASVWVKPLGNFDESRLSEFTSCIYWEGSRDTIAMPVTTLWKETQGTNPVKEPVTVTVPKTVTVPT
jgi:hypothetical protein